MGVIFLRNKVSGGAPAFDPATLFAGGEGGVWYEPNPSTCFTDTAGTTAAGVGDAVARINDGSGNGNHATQPTAAARPTLRQTAGGSYYLELDGVNDWLSAGDVTFLDGVANATIAYGLQKPTTTAQRAPLGKWLTNAGPVFTFAIDYFSNLNRFFIGNTAPSPPYFALSASDVPDGSDAIYVAQKTSTSLVVRKNAASFISASVAATFPDNSEPLAVGAKTEGGNASAFYANPIYAILIIDRVLTAEELGNLESYLAEKSGVTL